MIKFELGFQREYKSRWYVLLITIGLWMWYLCLFFGIAGVGAFFLLIGGIAHFFDSRARIKALQRKLNNESKRY